MEDRIQPITNKDVLPFKPLPIKVMEVISKPLTMYFEPRYHGLENVNADTPSMFVSNHTVLGMADGPLMVYELYKQTGVFPRSLVDNLHNEIPIWRDYITHVAGGVPGSRKNCAQLMEQGEHILVYPGGTREVCKRKGEENKLIWKNRKGFARMAMQFGYPIIPVSVLGGDKMYEIIKDGNDIMNSSIWSVLKQTGLAQKFFKNGDHIPPIVKGIGLTPIPRPVRLNHYYGKPVETKHLQDKFEDEAAQQEIRDQVVDQMYEQIEKLQEIRKDDKDGESLIRKILRNL